MSLTKRQPERQPAPHQEALRHVRQVAHSLGRVESLADLDMETLQEMCKRLWLAEAALTETVSQMAWKGQL